MNILLVDDQENVLRATKMLVDWEELEIGEVYTANSAKEAKAVLAQKQVDLMLTDIEMPGENGIELQKWQQENYPEIVCIFLTSHADFSYAKEAIHNGAFDYILQPARIPDIEAAVKKAVEHLKKQRELQEKSGHYEESIEDKRQSMVFSMFSQRGQFQRMAEFRKLSSVGETSVYFPWIYRIWGSETGKVISAFEKISRNKNLPGKTCTYYCRLNDNLIVGLNETSREYSDYTTITEEARLIIDVITEQLNCKMNIYYGSLCTDSLQDEIALLMEYACDRILEKNQVYHVTKKESLPLAMPDSSKWSRWLINGDGELVKNQIVNLLQMARTEETLNTTYTRTLIHAFLEACSIACYDQKMTLADLFDEKFTYDDMLQAFASAEELLEGVDRCLMNYKKQVAGANGADSGNFSVTERIGDLVRYLDENMDQMISRREAAKYIFLNEDYFTRVFKKEMGIGYKEYVLKMKTDYAKKLLAETAIPVTLIASKVGYENYTNFTQMFRKMTDMTPTEYRKKCQES